MDGSQGFASDRRFSRENAVWKAQNGIKTVKLSDLFSGTEERAPASESEVSFRVMCPTCEPRSAFGMSSFIATKLDTESGTNPLTRFDFCKLATLKTARAWQAIEQHKREAL